MTSPFTRTLRSLGDDRARPSWLVCAVALSLLVLWGAWFFNARVRVLESSDVARVETGGAAHPLQSVTAGRVLSSSLVLGRHVKAGEVLLRLDARSEELQLVAARARAAGLRDELTYLQAELDAQERGHAESRQASSAGAGGARAKRRGAEARAALAAEEARRLEALGNAGHVSQLEALRSSATARAMSANLEEALQGLERLRWEARMLGSEREAASFRLRREITVRQTERAELAVSIDRLEQERSRREITSPVDGVLGDVTSVPVGAVVAAGQKLGAVVPPGPLRVVAMFDDVAVGRLREGQRAQVRLHGFPWAQFGTLPARVASVGSEAAEGRVRVELTPLPEHRSRIPLQHGLTGAVEVEVERVAPVELVLRAVGRTISAAGGAGRRETGAVDVPDRRAQ